VQQLEVGTFNHPEHLNTPRLVADATGTTVWRWDQAEPFGVNVPDENPSGLGVFDLPLRLPGQYFDKETNFHYNYYRDYDPSIGRYVESDPIGLTGGLNTYVYAHAASLNYVDREGLISQGQAGYLGGLGGKAAGQLSEKLIEWLSQPGAAGQDVAAQLCAAYRGGRPRDLYSDCTVGCIDRLGKIQGLGKISGGWLLRCTESCEKYFVTCNKRAQSCPPDLPTSL
jgi:RHS repeat-associated protein